MKKGIKYPIYGFLAIIVIVIAAIPLIPMESYRGEIEKQITEAVGVEVTLGDISLVSLPQPGLKIDNVKLSDRGVDIVSLQDISLVPDLSSLLSDQPSIRVIKLSGIQLDIREISRLTSVLNKDADTNASPAVSIKRISADNSVVQIDDQNSFGPFEFTTDLSSSFQLESFSLELEQQRFQLTVLPKKENYAVSLDANNWTPPVQPEINVTRFKLDGLLSKNTFHAKAITASLYEGQVDGNLLVEWNDDWALDSRLEFKELNVAALLEVIGDQSLDGTAAGQLDIRSSANEPALLADNLFIRGDVSVTNGHLYNTDLEQAVRSLSTEWKAGGQTPFDEFKTHIEMNLSRIKLTNLSVTSSILAANGQLNIYDMKTLKGEITVGIDDPTGLLKMPLLVQGNINEPKIRPTDSALAGAAAGTALLGPGLGTAVGVKTGALLGKIGSLFGSDDKKPEKDKAPGKNDDNTLDDDSEF